MKRYHLMPAAAQDMLAIIEYIANDSPEAAGRVLDKIEKELARLAEFPGLGHKREDLTDHPVRSWSIHRYLVVYQPDRDPLEILRSRTTPKLEFRMNRHARMERPVNHEAPPRKSGTADQPHRGMGVSPVIPASAANASTTKGRKEKDRQ